ncbi:uncharacterized protein TNIN_95841 [Trichonephila inaurata madagascariensis]|uniref:Uncharacterized protein n=1 Tax=Trichonephila inaurata madagascariensis TaxID=2747483 RepID=A0A8X7BZJ1_9ARAC|nr:uncharacterized protein TNIN_95841 [Trichonephila inaurata madagascariensis]
MADNEDIPTIDATLDPPSAAQQIEVRNRTPKERSLVTKFINVTLCFMDKGRKRRCHPLAELPHAQSSLNVSSQLTQQTPEVRVPRLSRRDVIPNPGGQGTRGTPKRRQRTTANTRTQR